MAPRYRIDGVDLGQRQDLANMVAGVEPALLQAVVIGCRIRRQRQEVHHQALFAGTAALGDQTLGVVRLLDILVTTITELPGNPLRGRPHRGEHDRKDDDDLPPEYFGRGHDDQGSSIACLKSKCCISSGVRTAAAGYDSVGRMQHAVDGLLSEATRKTLRFGSISHFDPKRSFRAPLTYLPRSG